MWIKNVSKEFNFKLNENSLNENGHKLISTKPRYFDKILT